MIAGTPPPAAPSALLGRASEVAILADAVTAPGTRLVTVTGPPGVGKTRLALAAADAVAGRFPGGTAWVDLTLVDDARLVLLEIGRSLGVARAADEDPLDRIVAALPDEDVLVVLDNCEHVLDAAAEIGALLARGPTLRVLATSRERLRLTSEHEFSLPPLPIPPEQEVADLDRLGANPAVALLLDRAPSHVALDARTARALVDVCIRLDGLPLAIELAAARLRVFTPSELAFRLDHRMAVLTGDVRDAPARHRDLRGAIVWSHDLLAERDRVVFRRLSAFAGDWTIEAAQAVCGDRGAETPDAISSLLDKSLIRRTPDDDGDARFDMLVSLREFAAEQLRLHGEEDETRARHAAFFAASAQRWEATVGTDEEKATWPLLGRVRADLVAAYHFSRRGASDTDQTLWLAVGLGWFWYTRGSLADAATLIDVVAEAGEASSADVRAAALSAAGIVAFGLGRVEVADELLVRAAELSGAARDTRRIAFVMAFRGHVAREQGRTDDARAAYTSARAMYRDMDNARGTAWAAHDLGLLAAQVGDLVEAEVLLREAVATFRVLEYDWALAVSACMLASVLLRTGAGGAVDEPAALLGEALMLHDLVGDRRGVAQCIEGLAQVAFARGEAATAARLLGAAAAQRLRAATPPTDVEHTTIDRLDDAVARALGRGAADHERHTGRTMPVAAALTTAAGVATTAQGRGAPAVGDPLTPRQVQVASLVAAGNTNRQLARALGISEKTAEIHLRNIMERLNVPSRAGVAAWAATRGLSPPHRGNPL